MGRTPKLDNEKSISIRPNPRRADYSDEIDNKMLDRIKTKAKKGNESDEKWELVDGPAW